MHADMVFFPISVTHITFKERFQHLVLDMPWFDMQYFSLNASGLMWLLFKTPKSGYRYLEEIMKSR
jgi:hypothetical protein